MAIRFAYDGQMFANGYARQVGGETVEDALIEAAEKEGLVAKSWRSGSRTDKGVSAIENVGACELARPTINGLLPSLQRHLPAGIWVTGATEVAQDWQPRYNAIRTYEYLAPRQRETLSAMKQAASMFEGSHDMTAFARLEAHRNPVRQIDKAEVEETEFGWRFQVSSDGFLWNQVRRMVAAILAVGRGEATAADIAKSLESKTAHAKFGLAPAAGLLLRSVTYSPPLAWNLDAGSIDRRSLQSASQAMAIRAELLSALSGSSQAQDEV